MATTLTYTTKGNQTNKLYQMLKSTAKAYSKMKNLLQYFKDLKFVATKRHFFLLEDEITTTIPFLTEGNLIDKLDITI